MARVGDDLLAIVVKVLWQNVGQIKGVIHALLGMLVIPSCCHVTSTPPTVPVVCIGS